MFKNFTSFISKNLILISICLTILISKILLIKSFGGLGWEPDEYMHFLETRTIYTNFPSNLGMGINVWTKPLYAYTYGLFVQIFNIKEMWPMEIVSAMLILIISILVYKILRKLDVRISFALLGLILTNFTFILFRSSLSALTEPIFTMFIVSAFYLLLKKRFYLSSLLIGIAVLGRIEGALFILLWIGYYIYIRIEKRNLLLNIIIMFVPVAIWNFLGFLQTGRLFYLISNGYPTARGVYGHGNPIYYSEGFLRIEPLLSIIFILSVPLIYSFIKDKLKEQTFVASIFIVTFIVQNVLWIFGLFGTAGLMRYFIAIMPFMIMQDVYFLNIAADKLFSTKIQGYSLILICIVVQALITGSLFFRGGYSFSQLNHPKIEPELREAGVWLRQNISQDKLIFSDRPEVIYFAGRDLNKSNINLRQEWDHKSKGIYVYSTEWGEKVHNLKLNDFNGFNLLYKVEGKIYIFIQK